MSRSRTEVRLLFVLLLFVCIAPMATAQRRYGMRPEKPSQFVTVGYAPNTFKYRGGSNPAQRFDFRDPVFTLSYNRPSVSLAISYGLSSDSTSSTNRLFDAVLLSWGEFPLVGEKSEQGTLSVPVGIFTQYHRVLKDEGSGELSNDFGVTVLGLGAGASYRQMLGRRIRLEMRALPVIGFTSISFADGTGYSRILDTAATLHFDRAFGTAGLVIGYSFRTQVWDVGGLGAMSFSRDYYDYGEARHQFRAGITW